MCLMQHCHCRYIVITCTVSVALVAFFGGCIAHLLCFYVWLGTIILYYVCMYVCISGVLLKMEVGIRKRARQRDWRYPAYLWSLRWVYAVKNPPPEVGIRRIPAYTPQYTTGMYVCICALDTQVLVCFSVGSSAGQESAGTTDVDGRRAFINECNVGVGPRTASCCYQHSG